jgi:hypothetical protein
MLAAYMGFMLGELSHAQHILFFYENRDFAN